MNFLENITFRRTRTVSGSNVEVLNETLDVTTNSLPDISVDSSDEETFKLKERINKLEFELNSAHQEIESLSFENSYLKKQNEELLKKNDLYKKITCSPVSTKKIKDCTPKKLIQKKDKKIQTEVSLQMPKTTIIECDKVDAKRKNDNQRHINCVTTFKSPRKRKLCIISNCNYIGALKNIEATFSEHFEYCHYVTPGSGLSEILSNITEKVKQL